MKLMVFLPTTLAAVMAVQAQTNETPQAEAQTNTVAAEAAVSLPAKPTKTMSLMDCIQETVKHNIGLEISRSASQISFYDFRAGYGIYDPVLTGKAEHDYDKTLGSFDPILGIITGGEVERQERAYADIGGLLPWGMKYDLTSSLDKFYGTRNGVYFNQTVGTVDGTLTQPLLRNFWIDAPRLQVKIAKNRWKWSEMDLRLTLMTTITTVENAYYDLIAAQENVKVQEKALQLAEQLLAENKKRVEVGALAPLDEKQAESQVATAKSGLLGAQQTLASQQNTLKSLFTDKYRDVYDFDVQPAEGLSAPLAVLNVQDSWSKAMALRPDLLKAKLDAERQGIQLKYDRNQLFPQLDVWGSYGFASSGGSIVTYPDAFDEFSRGDQPSYSYGLVFSVPLSSQGPRNTFKASKLTLRQFLLTLKSTEQGILTEVDNDVIAAKAGYQKVAATRDARIYAEAALDAEQKKLENGKSTSFQVLSLQKDLTTARSAEIQALADYNKSLATLAQAEGTTLERRNVDLKVK